MADAKISDLPVASALAGTDVFVIVVDPDAEDGTKQITAELVTEAVLATAMVVVVHGSTAATSRPADALAVYWIGSVEPDNAEDSDLWHDNS